MKSPLRPCMVCQKLITVADVAAVREHLTREDGECSPTIVVCWQCAVEDEVVVSEQV